LPLPSWRIPRWRFALGAAVFALLFTAYFHGLREHAFIGSDGKGDVRLAVLFGLVLSVFSFFWLLAVGTFLQSVGERRRLVTRLSAPPRDGEFAAVEGVARAESRLLTAPVSGRSCLAYEYDVRLPSAHASSSASTPKHWPALSGIALAPTAIEGAHGRARLLGWSPLGQRFRREWFGPPPDRETLKRLSSLVKATTFEKMTGVRGFKLVGRLFDLQADEDGTLRQDWCLDERALKDRSDAAVSECVVAPGDRIAASGLWSEERRGLYGVVGRVGLDVWPGSVEDRRRRLAAESMGRLAFMTLMIAALHGIVALFWQSGEVVAAQRALLERQRAAVSLEDALRSRDPEGMRAALKAGADPNGSVGNGVTLLMSAAGFHDPAYARVLLEAGADPELAHPNWGTALTQAITANRHEVVELLVARGAYDFRVGPANGRRLPEDGGEPLALVRDHYYPAIVAGDQARVDELLVGESEGAIDFPLWRRVRPLHIESAEGYATDTAATFTVRGRDPDGRTRAWSYHMVRTGNADGPWRIEREWELR
jgi:hypothetical protein